MGVEVIIVPLRPYSRRKIFRGRPAGRAARIARRLRWYLLLFAFTAALVSISLYLRQISMEIALSDAQDIVILAINDAINRIMSENDYSAEHFVKLEKDSEGNVTAITSNMTHINGFSTLVLSEVVEAANSGVLDVRIPLGNLLGSNLLLGKGPDIPVEIIMLTSSFVEFENEFLSTGINQAKHRLVLLVDVDVDILIPWATITTRVETDVIIAETVIVGRVPETYVDVD